MSPEKEEKKPRISAIIAGMMVCMAVLFDALQFFATFLNIVPGLGIAVCWFLALFATVAFGVWFALSGVNYFTGKQAARKALVAISTVVVEFIPIIDALSAITSGVVLMILFSRLEDAEGSVASNLFTEGGVLTRFAQKTAQGVPRVDDLQQPWESKQESDARANILARNRGRRFDTPDHLYDPRESAKEKEGA